MSQDYISHFVAGLIGSFVSVTVCHPLEVARSRLNLQNATVSINKYQGFLHTIKLIYQEEGIAGYYKGYKATAVAVPVFHSLFFPIYKWNKHWLENKYKLIGVKQHIAATILTGFTCDFITNPLWVVRTRMQTQFLHDQVNSKYVSVAQSLKRISQEVFLSLNQEGFFALYKGFGASLLGLAHVVVQFPIYEYLRAKSLEKQPLTTLHIFEASVISKFIAVIATYPHVVIRTRLHDNRSLYKNFKSRMRLLDIVRAIYKQDQLSGFYLGIVPDLIRVLPMNAITFVVYENLSKQLEKSFHH